MDQPPVIDVSSLTDDDVALETLNRACSEWGFFFVVGHGIERRLFDAVHEQMHAFFGLPAADKRRVIRTADNVWGFYDRELTKNARDWKEIFDVGPRERAGPVAGAEPQWPKGLPGFQETCVEFMDSCRDLGHRLLAGVSLNLGMEAGYLAQAFGSEDSSFLRLNFYPLCDDPAPLDAPTNSVSGQLGINHHTDAGALTLLLLDRQPGLQVLVRDRWRLIEPVAGALLINIGDVVQVWSNDRYPAPLHRVAASTESPRYSAPFFFNPAYASDYAPLASVCDAAHPPRYRPINWGEFRAGRAAGDYADYGKEIQIEHFRI